MPSIRRGNKRRNGKVRTDLKIGTGNSPIPSEYRADLRYALYGTLSAGASLVASYGFRANSVFDPDFTGTGNQPQYFDQISPMYTKYRVLQMRARFTFSNETEETCNAVVYPSMSNVDPVNSSMYAQRFGRLITLGPKAGGSGVKTVVMTVDIAKIWGATKTAVRNEDDFAALVSGNPNNVVYLWVAVRNLGTTAPIVRYQYDLIYDTIFHMPVYVSQS